MSGAARAVPASPFSGSRKLGLPEAYQLPSGIAGRPEHNSVNSSGRGVIGIHSKVYPTGLCDQVVERGERDVCISCVLRRIVGWECGQRGIAYKEHVEIF